jgi:hypothetical protein
MPLITLKRTEWLTSGILALALLPLDHLASMASYSAG